MHNISNRHHQPHDAWDSRSEQFSKKIIFKSLAVSHRVVFHLSMIVVVTVAAVVIRGAHLVPPRYTPGRRRVVVVVVTPTALSPPPPSCRPAPASTPSIRLLPILVREQRPPLSAVRRVRPLHPDRVDWRRSQSRFHGGHAVRHGPLDRGYARSERGGREPVEGGKGLDYYRGGSASASPGRRRRPGGRCRDRVLSAIARLTSFVLVDFVLLLLPVVVVIVVLIVRRPR